MVNSIILPARVDEAGALSELALRSKATWGYSQDLLTSFRAELTLSAFALEAIGERRGRLPA